MNPLYTAPGGMEDLKLRARLLCTLGWRMAVAGAETRLIVQSVTTMAKTLSVTRLDLTLTRACIQVKLTSHLNEVFESRQISSFGINMRSLTLLHQICLKAAAGGYDSVEEIYHAIRAVRPRTYNHKLLILLEGLAAAAFAYLNGGTATAAAAALAGGLTVMLVRFALQRRGFYDKFVFIAAACCGCLTACLAGCLLQCEAPEGRLAVMASILILVPGFPYMNGFLDVFKGCTDIGINRLIQSAVLTGSAALGLLGALCLINVCPW